MMEAMTNAITTIKIPDWLEEIGYGIREERARAAAGLTPKVDGWYKSAGGKTRYVCKPCPVREAVDNLGVRMAKWTGQGDATVRLPVSVATLKLDQLVEMYLAAMYQRWKTGVPKKLDRATYDDLVRVLDDFAQAAGGNRVVVRMGPDDFSAYARTLAGAAASSRRRKIQYVDMMFNWAGPGKRYKNLIPFIVRGPDWVKPSDETIITDAADSDKAYSAAQVKAAFETVKADPLLNAAAHLGLNCAMGPKDLGTLPEAVVDLDGAQIVFPRGKTGVGRLCPLMPETVQALRDYLAFREKFKSVRPAAKGLFFRTRQGMPYARHFGGEGQDAGHKDNRLGRLWTKSVRLPFSGLRSTFATHADDWRDQRAVDVVMGHKVGKVGRHIRRHYAKRFPPERARALVEHVWPLAFGAAPAKALSTPRGRKRSKSSGQPAETGTSPATGHTPPA